MQKSHSPPLDRLQGRQVEIQLTQQAWFNDEKYALLFHPDQFLIPFLISVKKIMGWFIREEGDKVLITPILNGQKLDRDAPSKSIGVPKQYIGEIYELIRGSTAIAV